MDPKLISTVICVIISLINVSTGESDVCEKTGRVPTRLQVAFVVDRTYSFKEFLHKISGIVKEFHSRISKTFPGSEIGFTSFADFTKTQRYDKMTHCFTLDQRLTTSLSTLANSINKIEVSVGNDEYPENTLQAIMFTCADKTFGWSDHDYDSNGVYIQRVVIFTTDADDLISTVLKFNDERKRHAALGDGTDTCTNSLYPDHNLLSKVLNARKVRVIGALATTDYTPAKIIQLYEAHMKKIGVAHNLFKFPLNNYANLAASMESAIYQTVPCKPEPPPPTTTPLPPVISPATTTPTPTTTSPDPCVNGRAKTRLQVAFVVDRTYSFQDFLTKLPGIVTDFHSRISKTFPGSEIGVSSFADYTDTQRYDDMTKCFTLDQQLTTSLSTLSKSINKIRVSIGNKEYPENSLQAIMFTCADKSFGWSTSDYDSSGVAIQRVIIFMTDADDLISTKLEFKDAKYRHKAIGDGTDTCKNSLYPDYPLLSKVFKERKVRVIGGLAKSDTTPANIIKRYEAHMNEIGVDYNLFPFYMNHWATLAADMEKVIYKTVPCEPGTPSPPPTPSPPTPGPPPTDICEPGGRTKTKLQVAFVVDRTASFEDFLLELGTIVKEFYGKISTTFPSSELAITTFGDFKKAQRYDEETQRYDEQTQCYTVNQAFTQNLAELDKSSKYIDADSEGNPEAPENSLQAIMLTCADKKIGWNNADYDSNGAIIQRLIIMLTDNDDLISIANETKIFSDEHKRRKPLGDGTDTCENSLYPDYNILSQVLKRLNVRVITGMARTKHTPANIHERYANHFQKIGVKFNLFDFNLDTPKDLATNMQDAIYKTVPCKPTPNPPPPPPEPTTCGKNGKQKSKLQIAFVVDRTKSFETFFKQLPPLVHDFHTRISDTFPDSEFAFTSFADFTQTQRYDESDKCFTLDQKFTTSSSDLEKSISKVEASRGNDEYPENSLQALMFATSDKSIGWNNQAYDSSGALIQRLLFFMTDADDLISIGANFTDASQRLPPKGDGSDTCINSLYPDHSLISKVFKERDARVVGALAKSSTSPPNLIEVYNSHFTQISVKNTLIPFPTGNWDNFAPDMETAVYQTIPCKPVGFCAERVPTRLQVAFVVDRTMSFKEFYAKLPTIVKEFHTRISHTFPGSEMGFTSFADFTDGQRYDEMDKCFTLDQRLTTSLSDLEKSISKAEASRGNDEYPENSLQAIMFTCASQLFGWSSETLDSNGVFIQRVIIMMTDADDLSSVGAKFHDEASRIKPKGDGSDTCINSLYPDHSLISSVLKQREVRLIGGLAISSTSPKNLNSIYKTHFDTLGVPYNLFQFDLDKPENLAEAMERALLKTVPCKPEPTTPNPDPDPICGAGGRDKTKLQVVFVVDRTSSFKNFFLKLAVILHDFYEKISPTFPDAEIALTTFGDFWSMTQRYDEFSMCYTLDTALTTDLGKLDKGILKVIKTDQFYGDDLPENPLQAVMLTAADLKLGWNNEDVDSNGAAIQRVIIMMTDADDIISKKFDFKDASRRHPPRGDGSDTCTNSFYPDYDLIGQVLNDRQALLIGALASSKTSPKNITEIYKNHFKNIGVEPHLFTFALDNVETLSVDLATSLFKTVPCKTMPTPPIDPIDECEKHVEARVQVAFVVDRTSSFTSKFFKKFGEILDKLYTKLESRFPGTKIAITLFTDYTSRQWNHGGLFLNNNFLPDKSSCYQTHHKFTSELKNLKTSMSRIPVYFGAGGDRPENQLTAILMTAADKNIGWNAPDEDKKGVFVFKMICMLTDSDSHTEEDNDPVHFRDFTNRRPALGNGNDTCTNALIPEYSVISRVLKKRKITLLGLLSKHSDKKIFDHWNDHFTKLGVPYGLAEFSVNKADMIFDILNKAIMKMIPCDGMKPTPPPPVIPPGPTPRPTRPPIVDKCGPIGADRDACEAKGCQFCCNTMTCRRVGSKKPPSCYNGGCVGDCFRPDACYSRAAHCHYEEDTGKCIDCTHVKLQLAFVVDAASASAIESFKQLAKLGSTLKKLFQDPEFAVTSFSDWERDAWAGTNGHNDPDGCYRVVQKFTTADSKLVSAASKMQFTESGWTENGDTGLAWTSAAKDLGWRRERTISDGRQVVRLMILVDNQFVNPEGRLERPGSRTVSKGDGTDTCRNNLPVTRKLMSDVLVRDMMSVIGVFTVDENKEVISQWKDLFSGMMQVPYSSFESKISMDDLASHIRALVVRQNMDERCMFPTNTTRPPPPPPTTPAPPTRRPTRPPIVDKCGPIGADRDACEAQGCQFCCNTMKCIRVGAKLPPSCYNGGCVGDCFRPTVCNSRADHCHYEENTGRCIDCTYVKLQLAFVVDTASQSAVNSFKELSKLATPLKTTFRDPEFAITSFADWERSAWSSVIGHNDPDNCYRVVQKFSTVPSKIVSVASKMTATESSITENGDTGLAWTSASKDLGWKRERTIADGRQVIRLMILVDNKFLNPEGRLGINGSRTVSKGDGTDTCRNNLPVTRKLLRDVLVRDMMSVIGVYTVDEEKEVIAKWKDLFSGMTEVSYSSFDSKIPMADLVKNIRALVVGQNMHEKCMPTNTTRPPPPPPPPIIPPPPPPPTTTPPPPVIPPPPPTTTPPPPVIPPPPPLPTTTPPPPVIPPPPPPTTTTTPRPTTTPPTPTTPDPCVNGRTKTRLQVAFVVDRTYSFKDFLTKLPGIVNEFHSRISKTFPGSEIGVSSFADYTFTQRYDEMTQCFTLDQRLTTSLSTLAQSIKRIRVSVGNNEYPENSLQAIMFTCTDKSFGWSSEDFDSSGVAIQRVIIFMTDADDLISTRLEFKDKKYRHQALGDGTDTCKNSLYPDYPLLSKVFKGRNVRIIGGLARTDYTPANIIKRYESHLDKTGVDYNLFPFYMNHWATLAADMEKVIYKTVPCEPGNPSPPPMPTTTPAPPTPGPPPPPPTDICEPGGRTKTKLQVAFVVDRTRSFETFLPQVGSIINEFYAKISPTFPNSELAITTFGDFTITQRYDEQTQCYTVNQPFTQNLAELNKSSTGISTLSPGNTDGPENPLQAIMFTGADKKLGWNTKDYDSNGAIIQRIIIMMTDNDDLITQGVTFKDEDKRHDPKGDGTDSCTNSKYPKYEHISGVLKNLDIKVIGALAIANYIEIYKDHFTQMDVEHDLFPFEVNNVVGLANDLVNSIFKTVPCDPKLPVVECMQRPPTSPSHDINKYCHPVGSTDQGKEVDYGVCIKDAKGNFVVTENCPCDPHLPSCACDPLDGCDEWDPPGYNTLGF